MYTIIDPLIDRHLRLVVQNYKAALPMIPLSNPYRSDAVQGRSISHCAGTRAIGCGLNNWTIGGTHTDRTTSNEESI